MKSNVKRLNIRGITSLKEKSVLFLAIISYLIPLCITVYSIFSGSIAFWYDPARDLLSGLANLEKITLIGPTSGIPGLFYGPYWIWMISIGLLFSHDPRIVAFIVAAVPYFVVLPFVFYKLSIIVGKIPAIIGWTLFMLAYGGYSAQLWNPHPAPLLVFMLLTLLVFIPEKYRSVYGVLYILFTGFIAGLLIQFHISFGIAVVSGVFVYLFGYFILQIIRQKKRKEVVLRSVFTVLLLGIGIAISALPFFVFELRHGFNQITTILTTLTSQHAVVGVIGISNSEIMNFFLERFARLLSLPISIAIGIGMLSIGLYIYELWKQRKEYKAEEIRLATLPVVIGAWVLVVYLSSKNPVWDYHFIGVEVLFVLLIVSLLARAKMLIYVYGVIAVYIAVMAVKSFYIEVNSDPLRLTSLATKEHVVERVFEDAPDHQFGFNAYNPAIHSYDYDYLVQWIAEKNASSEPTKDTLSVDTVYLVIPPNTSSEIADDFINYKTPNTEFQTVDSWEVVDGTKVVKRAKNDSLNNI